jgi:hypothetical protein
VEIVETIVHGLGSSFKIVCLSNCGKIGTFNSCPMIGPKKNVYEVNRRAVLAMRFLGQGQSGLRSFCGIMDLPAPVKQATYDCIVENMHLACKNVAEKSMVHAVREEKIASSSDQELTQHITVSGDGTWRTRGFSSLHGVCTVIGAMNGKVLDLQVMSSFCKECESHSPMKGTEEYDQWKTAHESNCSANHRGSSGKMEPDGMVKIFGRSQEKYDVMYTGYIGDGDAKTYCALVSSRPYGAQEVTKIECTWHEQKRMGTRLRTMKKTMSGQVLSDGKTIGGRGRLTDDVINQLTVYYGNAIRANKNSVADMSRGIWAIWHHKRSTDDYPDHGFCPTGEQSWCKWQRAQTSGIPDPFCHRNSVPVVVMDAVKPVFSDLSQTALLQRCLGGMTQNNNESFNAVLWKLAPKSGFNGTKTVETASHIAAAMFNDGKQAILHIMREMELEVGLSTTKSYFFLDSTGCPKYLSRF